MFFFILRRPLCIPISLQNRPFCIVLKNPCFHSKCQKHRKTRYLSLSPAGHLSACDILLLLCLANKSVLLWSAHHPCLPARREKEGLRVWGGGSGNWRGPSVGSKACPYSGRANNSAIDQIPQEESEHLSCFSIYVYN